jgi:hypothetical protein
MDPDLPYEDETFVETRKVPAVGQDGVNGNFWFIIQHKGSETVFRTLARDRDELAAKIAAGEYEDVDPRNNQSPPDLDDDATDE